MAKNVQMAKATFANAQTGVGRVATQQANAECRGQFRQLMPHLLAEQSVQRGKGFVKQMPPG